MKFYFFPQSIYTCTVAFSDLFNDMGVRVYDKQNQIVGYKPVPVTLAPKEKIAHILNVSEVNDVDPQSDNYLPRISISSPDIQFDAERMRGKYEKRRMSVEYDTGTQTRTVLTDIQSIPMSLTFEVSIWTKYYIDMTQLLENIMVWFSPEAYVSFKERNFGIEHKSRVILTSSSKNFVYEYGETERRVLQWNLTFQMDGIMWKPMEMSKEVICNIISIAGVPCKKSPFFGEKVIVYEPKSNSYESILTKNPKLSIFELDDEEKYEKMVKYWGQANTVMDKPVYETCVTNNCQEEVGPKPEWDPSFGNTPCNPVKKKPCIVIDPVTQDISAYWQDQILGEDNKIRIFSFNQVYNSRGETIIDTRQIPMSAYPMNCYPVYTEDVTSIPPSSSTLPPITSAPPSGTEIPPISGCEYPEYTTIG